ncbi:MAG: peptidase M23 [Gammaproteobacteria bacterium HGW-Gammaproteobacteria-8]|nr:MAG: peptidase M23 [Gammaproteobacteria bacterium HGW-Gammaproteobacteria-8]
MRHNYQITISDCRGARHYTLTQLMRRLALAGGAASLLLFFSCLLVIHALSSRVDSLDRGLAESKQRNAAIQAENARLLTQQTELNRQIESRAAELIALTDDLEHLETIIGINAPPALPVAERISVASHTAFEKQLLLASIPSGSPLEAAQVTSKFGMREHPVIEQTRLHGGIDLRASIGTEVTATADGVVEYAGNNAGSGMGKMIKVVHNYGFATIYAHLSEIEVEVGDYVAQGQPIGRSGNTGLSAAPHLHYEVRYLGRRLDPASFMNWSLDRFDTVFEQEERVQWQSLARTVRNKVQVMAPPSSQQAPSLSAISP